ncbi:MAG TPA: FxsB family cyclophane-forming radical SAM/SPASM peptide maturase [Actinocrinis sp.]|uniref:FxsB family cyclophane-forming radical SAM/SPASM peptide maturase n=1 Tax=Actinocrinis sp. TaxID=1920516 RepID=UPI002DDCBF3D|nr:FxsB family cyclophane-forming radical SAM/SPASM peptide maturase [Actinocrinis sp.]HEV2346191.1 FxsB family cyclophane-forming radical SAM/SPASM peptide maturase [Actinocrinis sp.]
MTHILPFRQFVLKVHSRCDLACDHCYIYEHADQSWRGRPKAISDATASLVAERIAEHAVAHQLPEVHVVLHGGEPLLLGLERTRTVLTVLRDRIEPVTRLDLRIHTNGVLLDAEFCALFAEFGVRVGVSLDGDRASNDRHRRFANGRSSHSDVLRALALLRRPQFARLYAGILCTIDIGNDPVAVYEALAAERPPRVDLLLPHATWDTPPTRPNAARAQYADWLIAVFDRWQADGSPFPIRTFDSILAVLRGEPSQTESLGLTPSDLLVIETDGAIEQADSLKTAFDGAAATGLNIADHTLDEAAEHEGIEARQQGLAGLCRTCRLCPVVDVCGGGLYAHRFRSGTGFANPSVYCDDLKATILHVRSRTTTVREPSHALHAADFDGLASGYGSGEAVRSLAESQDSIRRKLVGTLIAETRSTASLAAAGDLLAELDSRAPQAVERVLRHSRTRAWAAECLDALHAGRAQAVRLNHLNALAAAAAVLAGATAELTVPVVAGAVRLPMVGSFPTRGQSDALVSITGSGITITCDTDRLRLEFGDPTPDPAWQPVHRLATRDFDICLEEADAYSEHQGSEIGRISATEAKAWQSGFADAIDLLAAGMPAYLPGLQAGLRALMPLGASRPDPAAATRESFGVVGAVLSEDPAALALQLVHTFQRVKIGGILDLFHLFDRSASVAVYNTPWHPDPLPLSGMLEEAYVGVGVTEFWRTARSAGGTTTEALAQAEFARWRRDTADAVGQLRDCADLTDLGRRFVDGMQLTVTTWFDDPAGQPVQAALRQTGALPRAEPETGLRAQR